MFPIGELNKSEVREIAAELDLVTADKKDSQGLCFIGKVRLPEFLQQQLKPKEGVIVQIPNDSTIYNREVPEFSNQEEALKFNSQKFQLLYRGWKSSGQASGSSLFYQGSAQRPGSGRYC